MPEMCVFFLDVKSFELACFHELKHCILKAQHTNGVVQLRSHIAEEFPLFPTATSRQCCFHKGSTTLPQLKSTSISCPDKYGDLQLKAAKAEQADIQEPWKIWSVLTCRTHVPP